MNPMTLENYVTIVTAEEIEEGIHRVLGRLGLTFDALRQQALEGSFMSERARLTWFAIGDPDPGF